MKNICEMENVNLRKNFQMQQDLKKNSEKIAHKFSF